MSISRYTLRMLRSTYATCKYSASPSPRLRAEFATTTSEFELVPRPCQSHRAFAAPVKYGPRLRNHVGAMRILSASSWKAEARRSIQACRCQEQSTDLIGHKSEQKLSKKVYECITAEVLESGSVGLIVLDRPATLNALSEALMYEVVDACQTLDGVQEVGAIVITGRGKAFAAGADIKEMKDKSFVETHESRLFSHWNSLSGISKPIIAAVNGFALGGGCELAMACDIILAGEKALFGQPEVNLGVIPGIGGTQRLIREVGKSRAMEMILTGKAFMNATEAAERGLVSRVVPGDNDALVAEAISVAKSIAEKSRPAVAMAKEAVNAAYELGLREGIKREHSLFCATFALADQKEGMTAFVEKRKPKFLHK